jgi:hypothetical protein
LADKAAALSWIRNGCASCWRGPSPGMSLSFNHLDSGAEARFIQRAGSEPRLVLYGDEAESEASPAR